MSYSIDTTVAHNLKVLRLKHHMTQQELAKRANISKQTISNLEKGQGATSKTLERLAECLNTSPLSFYHEVENDESVKFKRVSMPKINTFNPNTYIDDLQGIISKILNDTKDFMYTQEISPIIKNTFEENITIFFKELNIETDIKNKNIYFSFEDILLNNIKQAIYNQKSDLDYILDDIIEDENKS